MEGIGHGTVCDTVKSTEFQGREVSFYFSYFEHWWLDLNLKSIKNTIGLKKKSSLEDILGKLS